MKYITAVPASAGLAVGTVRYLRHTQSGLGRAVRSPKEEQEAFENAVRETQDQLIRLERRAAAQDRDIFMVQRVLLEDEGLRQEVASYIRVGAGAAASVERAAGIFAGRIRALEDPYMRERACDILDACRRVVKVLDGQPHETLRLTGPAILVAEELYPTDIVTLDRSLVLGFITSAGSPNAHAAIIARTMGIPAAVMAGPELLEGCDGRTLALNGDTGEAYLDPDEATKTRFAHKLRLQRRHTLSQERLRAAPCTTKDGTRISLMADCASVEDVRTAVEAGADGVGLLLSEYLLLAGRVNGEEEQYGFYAACLAAAQGRPVTICTFDVAPDKTGTEFPREEEANPAMGLCGVRYCLAHPDFFETQLRALLRAGLAGNLRILLPMVSTRDEFEHALDAVYRAKCALRERGVPFAETVPVGAFIETPAAALTAGDLARRAAFFNVGTNNLIQYTYAADRVNPQVRAYLPAASPAVYRLVRFAVEAAAEARIPLCLCGEGSLLLAGLLDTLCAHQKLRGAGFTVTVPADAAQAALLQDKGFAKAFALRCLPREVSRNLWSQAEFDTVTAKKLCELREQFWKDTVQLSPERMAVVLQELYARGATIVSNEHGYGIYFRKEDTLYFVEMMADSDRAAEILMEAAREKEVIVEKAVITVGAAQPLFLGEGTRQEYGMIRFDAEPFDVSESYLRLMLEN